MVIGNSPSETRPEQSYSAPVKSSRSKRIPNVAVPVTGVNPVTSVVSALAL